jgi:hypothetical protein
MYRIHRHVVDNSVLDTQLSGFGAILTVSDHREGGYTTMRLDGYMLPGSQTRCSCAGETNSAHNFLDNGLICGIFRFRRIRTLIAERASFINFISSPTVGALA